MDSEKTYVLIHLWATTGGFKKRMEMLMDLLDRRGRLVRVQSFGAFLRFLSKPRRAKESVSVLIYGSFIAPLVVLLRLLHRRIPVFYMVRGDEVTYARQAGRRLQARASLWCQRLLKVLGCRFVFVCEDLRALFERRLGAFKRYSVLPNTLGCPLPPIGKFGGRIALVGDFGTVKNTEWALHRLSRGRYEVDLYGASAVPDQWRRPWLNCRGVVADLPKELAQRPALVVLPYVDAGFPNVALEAFSAGCPVAVHQKFPFEYLPIHDAWRFTLSDNGVTTDANQANESSELELFLDQLREQGRDFRQDNADLIHLAQSSWEQRVWDVLG